MAGGRPKGSTQKPRLADYLTAKQTDALVQKAIQLALSGNESMIKLLIEQKFGKAVQPIGGDDERPLIIKFDDCFTPSTKRDS